MRRPGWPAPRARPASRSIPSPWAVARSGRPSPCSPPTCARSCCPPCWNQVGRGSTTGARAGARDDAPMPGSIFVRDGRLQVEGCDATALAARHGTPCYVVSEAQLRANARRISAAFAAAWPHGPVEVLPAFKAAPSLAIRAILTDEGLGCDAFGGPELRGALRAGVPGERISLNGPRKDVATLAAAIGAGATVTLEDAGELEALRAAVAPAGRTARVHLRLRPDYARITAA